MMPFQVGVVSPVAFWGIAHAGFLTASHSPKSRLINGKTVLLELHTSTEYSRFINIRFMFTVECKKACTIKLLAGVLTRIVWLFLGGGLPYLLPERLTGSQEVSGSIPLISTI